MAADKVVATLRVPSAAANRSRRLYCWTLLLTVVGQVFFSPAATAQFGGVPLGELSEVVQIDEADHPTVALLQAAKAHLAERQWNEGLEKLRQVEQTADGRLFKFDDHRYIPLRNYCQMLLAALPADALSQYRSHVDSLAKRWYERAVTERDAKPLQRVVDELFASSYGDDSLYTLGEIALEHGDYHNARWHWERISPELWRMAEDGQVAEVDRREPPAATNEDGSPWISPDNDLNLADVRARLVLVSILEGDLPRAKAEHRLLGKYHPDARGKLGGREVVYADALAEMIEAARSWPKPADGNRDWPTFAGSPTRNHVASRELAIGGRGVSLAVPPIMPFHSGLPNPQNIVGIGIGIREEPPAAEATAALSYHPVLADGLLLFNQRDEILAFHADTGKPAWPGDAKKPGRIFLGDTEADSIAGRSIRGGAAQALGVPQFTLTVFDRWLLARMGSPITARLGKARAWDSSYVVCLDLSAQGRLQWKLSPDDSRWAFEGSPLCDGTNVYVAMRYSDGTGSPQQHVACFDLQTGSRRWRRMVCAAQSMSRGLMDDVTHNLLTLAGDTLYLNTNLGAVAAIETATGRIQWLATYPRAERNDKALSAHRDLNPAVYHRGTLFVAPTDFAGIMALDACTGQLLWDSEPPGEAVHLLGVSGGKLWASGDALWALDAKGGKVVYHSAATTAGALAAVDSRRDIVGHGRGLLAADKVYWPVRRKGQADQDDDDQDTQPQFEIRIFDAATAKEASPPIRLDTLNPPCESGNLVMTDRHFVIAGADRVMLFEIKSRPGGPMTQPLNVISRPLTPDS